MNNSISNTPVDKLESAIAMLAFTNTCLMAITDEDYTTGNISQLEQFGLQQILFHIEEVMRDVQSDISHEAPLFSSEELPPVFMKRPYMSQVKAKSEGTERAGQMRKQKPL